jgi:hypothetical protein
VSEQKEISLHWKAKKVRMTDERYNLTDEFYDVLGDICDIIEKAAKKYIDMNKYEIYTNFDANIYNEGTVVQFAAQRVDIYLINKATKDKEWAGSIEFADDCWNSVTDKEKDNGYVLVYSSKDIREDAEEIFRDWAKEEAEEDE